MLNRENYNFFRILLYVYIKRNAVLLFTQTHFTVTPKSEVTNLPLKILIIT